MIESNYEYHCLSCERDRHAKFFMIWADDKTRSRRCDSCQDDPIVKRRLANSKAERNAKPEADANIPLLVGLAKQASAKQHVQTRRKIEDIKMMREYGLDEGDL